MPTAEVRRRNSGAMVLVVAIRLLATAIGTALGAVVVQALVGTTASATVFALIAGIIVVRLVLITVDWRTTTYVLRDDAIEYRVGRVSTSAQRIPYASIHGARRDEPWLLRLLGRAELSIEHGAGDAQQLHFAALRASSIDEILRRVDSANPGAVDDAIASDDAAHDTHAARAEPTVDADRPPLLRYAVARGRYLLAIPLAMAGLGIVAQLTGTDYAAAFDLVRGAWQSQPTIVQVGAVAVTAIVIVAVGVGARFASIAGYRRVLTSRALETRQGLVGSSERSLSRSDATVVELRRPPLYRALGRTMLLASGGSGRGDPPLDLAPDVDVADEADAASWAVPAPSGDATIVRTHASRPVGIVLVGAGAAAGAAALLAPLGGAWAPVAATAVALVSFAVLARSRMRLAIHSDGGVEIARTWATSRRWWLRRTSILHVEVAHGPLSRILPSSTLRIVVADRGARTFAIRGLTRTSASEAYRRLRDARDLGTYSYLRNRDR